jgi:PAS domain S-box-containing protein
MDDARARLYSLITIGAFTALVALAFFGRQPWAPAVAAVIGVVGIAVLVAARRAYLVEHRNRTANEQAVRASEAKFAGILEIAIDAIISIDESQRIIHYNQGAEKIFGYSAAEAVGLHLNELIPERFRAAHIPHVEAFVASPETARMMGHRREIFGLRKNGEEFPAEASISKLGVPGSRVYTVVLRDISDRKRAMELEHLLGTSGAVLTSSLDFDATLRAIARLPIPVLADVCLVDVTGASGRMLHCAAARRDLSRSEELTEIDVRPGGLSETIQRALDGEGARIIDRIDPTWFGEIAATEAEHDVLARLKPVAAMVIPLAARSGHTGVITLFSAKHRYEVTDLSTANTLAIRSAFALDNARLYREAQRATRARDEVLGVVSHDLRNPLSAVAMCTRVLLDSPPQQEEQRRELYGAIAEASRLMDRLIQDLLDISSIEAGRLPVHRSIQEIKPLVESAVGMLQGRAADQGITLRASVPTGLPALYVDGPRIIQVLTNIIGNAIKFTENGGSANVSTEHDLDRVVIRVADSGRGIPADQLPHVFERFWRAPSGSVRGSAGLGLTIAKGIVEAHGGKVWAESNMGSGTTVSFSLPLPDYAPDI